MNIMKFFSRKKDNETRKRSDSVDLVLIKSNLKVNIRSDDHEIRCNFIQKLPIKIKLVIKDVISNIKKEEEFVKNKKTGKIIITNIDSLPEDIYITISDLKYRGRKLKELFYFYLSYQEIENPVVWRICNFVTDYSGYIYEYHFCEEINLTPPFSSKIKKRDIHLIKMYLDYMLKQKKLYFRRGKYFIKFDYYKGVFEAFVFDEKRSYEINNTEGGFKKTKINNFRLAGMYKNKDFKIEAFEKIVTLSKHSKLFNDEEGLNEWKKSEEGKTWKKAQKYNIKKQEITFYYQKYLGISLFNYLNEQNKKSQKIPVISIETLIEGIILIINRKYQVFDIKIGNILIDVEDENEFNIIFIDFYHSNNYTLSILEDLQKVINNTEKEFYTSIFKQPFVRFYELFFAYFKIFSYSHNTGTLPFFDIKMNVRLMARVLELIINHIKHIPTLSSIKTDPAPFFHMKEACDWLFKAFKNSKNAEGNDLHIPEFTFSDKSNIDSLQKDLVILQKELDNFCLREKCTRVDLNAYLARLKNGLKNNK